MLAHVKDVPQLARLWYESKATSTFAAMEEPWTLEACATFIMGQLHKSTSHIAVEKRENRVVAACGVQLDRTFIPPHIPISLEWMWVGKGKAAVKVLHSAQQWSKEHGARWLVCATHNPRKGRFTEQLHWRPLC